MSLQRLRTDFRFAIITLFGVIAVIAIVPFAVYRFARGDIVAGWVDMGILASIGLAIAHVWRGGRQTVAALFVVVATTAGCVWVALLLGLPGLLWMYPVLVSHYLLLDRGRAALASVAAVGFLLLHGGPFDSDLHKAMFLVTSAVTSVFAFIFAQHNDRQREQLEKLAHHDALTGVGNRRALERELRIAVAARRRGKGQHGLLLLDLDHFKRINDRDGHEAGDAVLVDFVDILRRSSRADDRVFRMGGEEFVLLVTAQDAECLRACGENLRRRVGAELRPGADPVTVSVGGALLQAREQPQDWLARADAAMYEAKRAGRDRVVIAGKEEITVPATVG